MCSSILLWRSCRLWACVCNLYHFGTVEVITFSQRNQQEFFQCERASAKKCQGRLCFQRKHAFFGRPPFCTIDYVCETAKSAKKLVRIGSEGRPPLRLRKMYAFETLYFTIPYHIPFFMNTHTVRTGQPICTSNSRKDAIWRKEVHFGSGIAVKSR